MAFTSYFYDSTVTEPSWSKAAIRVARSNYGVVGINDLKVTVAAGDRTVAVGTGDCWGKGVYDINGSSVNKSLATVGSGVRYDLIAVHRDWNTNTTSIIVITGSATRGIPSRAIGYGTTDDQPLALVKVTAGSTAITEIIDLRCWAGSGGGLVARDALVKQYLNEPGTGLYVGGIDWIYSVSSTGSAAWVNKDGNLYSVVAPGLLTNWTVTGPISIDTSSGKRHVLGHLQITRAAAAGRDFVGVDYVALAALIPAGARGAHPILYVPGVVTGQGRPAEFVHFAVNPSTGVVSVRPADGSITIYQGVSMFLDFEYYV